MRPHLHAHARDAAARAAPQALQPGRLQQAGEGVVQGGQHLVGERWGGGRREPMCAHACVRVCACLCPGCVPVPVRAYTWC